MARRYIGEATIYITYHDDGTYKGRVVVKRDGVPDRASWSFDELRAPACGFAFGYDSPRAYDKMAAAAVSFGSYYSTGNRGDDVPEWAPEAWIADSISAGTCGDMDERGNYSVRRSVSV